VIIKEHDKRQKPMTKEHTDISPPGKQRLMNQNEDTPGA